MTFAPEAWPFVLPFWTAAALLALAGRPGWSAGALALGLGVLLFFRNPRRRFDGDAAVVLAPADGRVMRIDRVEDPALGPGRFHRVVTFLSAFDVHVQRTPAAGEVIASHATTGRKVAAFLPHAGEVNENHLTAIRLPRGGVVGVRQIAGLVARRVVCYLEPGERVERGQMLGLIKFGSRVDLLVPEGFRLLVAEGDRLRNGSTPVAVPPTLAASEEREDGR